MKRLSAAVVAALVASAGVASAATIQFNVDRGLISGAREYGVGQNTVDVDAYTYDGDRRGENGSRTFLASWSGDRGGLGVSTNCTTTWRGTTCDDDSHQVDGARSGPDELVVLDFGSRVVNLTSITFARYYSTGDNGGDRFDLFAFGNGATSTATQHSLDQMIDCGDSGCTISVAALRYTGSIFGIGASRSTSEFKIQAVSFEVVPLPAAGWGLIAGLGALAALKRRRKAA